jgi:hypothetical protein
MKKMKKYKFNISLFSLILLFPLLYSCCNDKQNEFIDEIQIVIPDSLYSFFPKKDSFDLKLNLMSTNAQKDGRQGESDTFLDVHFIKNYICKHVTQFEFLVYDLLEEAIDSLSPTDDNYFIIKYESDILKMYDYKTLKEKYQESVNKYILPSFHEDIRNFFGINYNLTTVCGLPDDYEILIMKSGRNYVLPDNSAWKFDWKLLPTRLKHGYTSGVAYRSYKDPIIYWCIAW